MNNYLYVHTKVRRLGYLKLLIQQFFKTDFQSIMTFNMYFEKIASSDLIKNQLHDYSYLFNRDSKGIIEKINTGRSAYPYIKFAEDLNLIAKSNYSYVLAKYCKVYRVIYYKYLVEKDRYKHIGDNIDPYEYDLFDSVKEFPNIFLCNNLDKCFFLSLILKNDFLIIKSILYIIFCGNNSPVSTKGIKFYFIKIKLFETMISELQTFLSKSLMATDEKNKIRDLIRKYQSNTFSMRSFENLVEPRINWLMDLDLIDNSKYKYDRLSLSEQGEKLFKAIKSEINVNSLLENKYFSIINDLYNISNKVDKPSDKKIDKYIDEAFDYFKTLAPNRITISQAINYVCFSCMLKDGQIAEYQEIKNHLFKSEKKQYIIDWFPSENDGSMKKRE